jgi:RND family efflux transporter MFP subunit
MKIIYWFLLFIFSTASNIVQAADFDATITLPPRLELSLPVSGVVKTVNVTAGQRVTRGDELLALDPVPFNAAKTYAQSRLTIQQSLLTESQRDLKQQQELYERTVLATVELENAELRVKRDKASVETAKAELAEAVYELDYSRLVAPFDALILSVEVNPGQSINNALQSKTLITLVRQNYYQANFYVKAEALDTLQVGQPVTVNAEGENYKAVISSISYEPMQSSGGNSGMYMVLAGFTTEKKTIPIGVKATVHIDK